MDKRDNRQLIERCLCEDSDAWNEFIDRFSGLVNWSIKRKLKKYECTYLKSDIDEIFQHVFTTIWEKKSLSKVSERDNISPWLIVIASHATIDYIRKRRAQENLLRNSYKKEKSSITHNELFVREHRDLIDKALQLLNDKERTYLELSSISGKRHKEIAEIFNTSVNSVSTVIARAKSKARRYLESKGIL